MQPTTTCKLVATVLLTSGLAFAADPQKRAWTRPSNDAVATVTLAAAQGFAPAQFRKGKRDQPRPQSREERIERRRKLGGLAPPGFKPSPFAYSKPLRTKR